MGEEVEAISDKKELREGEREEDISEHSMQSGMHTIKNLL